MILCVLFWGLYPVVTLAQQVCGITASSSEQVNEHHCHILRGPALPSRQRHPIIVWVISSLPISILSNFRILHEIICISSNIIYFILLKQLLTIYEFILVSFFLSLPLSVLMYF